MRAPRLVQASTLGDPIRLTGWYVQGTAQIRRGYGQSEWSIVGAPRFSPYHSPIRHSPLPPPLLELLQLLELLELLFASPQQDDRSALESDFVDGAGTFELVGASENHVNGRLSLGFEALQ